jgi:hypothetical protein
LGARINPGFVCVGPERTGTSWLYVALSGHPEIAMPPVKEIRYFYDCAAYPGETLLQRFSAAGDWHCREYRAYVAERLASYRRNPLQRQLFWDLKYLFGRRSIRWYRALFDRDKIAGDISPQYFSMPDSQLERMARHLGGVKVLILLRDPIEWSWSFARMSLIKDRACVPDWELEEFFLEYRNYYPTVEAIERWKRYFPPDRVFVGFFDKLREEPRRFLDEVCDFIGVSRRAPVPASVNVGGGPPLPAETLSYLRALWLPEIERLCEVYAPYPQTWRERHRSA